MQEWLKWGKIKMIIFSEVKENKGKNNQMELEEGSKGKRFRQKQVEL